MLKWLVQRTGEVGGHHAGATLDVLTEDPLATINFGEEVSNLPYMNGAKIGVRAPSPWDGIMCRADVQKFKT